MPSDSSRREAKVGRAAVVGIGALLLGVAVGLVGVHELRAKADATETTSTDTGPRPAIGGWPKDANGDGVVSDSGDERIPELIRAVGDNGTLGYVRYEDYTGPQPSNPQQALEMPMSRVIPVYSADGSNVVDHLTLAQGPTTPITRPDSSKQSSP
jgi:hypothetical protein